MCNCKQQPQQPIVPKGITPIQVISEPTVYNFDREEIIRIKDYVISTNKTEVERQFVKDSLLKHFGDMIPDYCDQNCLRHIRLRTDYMESVIK